MKTVILNRDEVRALLDAGELRIGRMVDGTSRKRYGRPGDRLLVREAFSSRRDADRIKIRYLADGREGEPRWFPIDSDTKKRFATQTYRTWPGKHAPRWLCRLVVEVLCVEERLRGARRVVVLSVRLAEDTGAH